MTNVINLKSYIGLCSPNCILLIRFRNTVKEKKTRESLYKFLIHDPQTLDDFLLLI